MPITEPPHVIASKRIQELPDESIRSNFAKALRDSLRFDDDDNPSQLKSPHVLREEYGIGFEDQLEYCISLDKGNAHSLLHHQGKRISLDTLRKRFSKASYAQMFDRSPAKAGNSYIFTYAEWLYMIDYKHEVSFPKELKSYIR